MEIAGTRKLIVAALVAGIVAVPAHGSTAADPAANAAPTDPNLGGAQTFDIMNVPEALDRAAAYGRAPLQDVIVMAGDTGLDLDHPDIAPRLYSLPAPVLAPNQYDFPGGFGDETVQAGAPGYDMIGNGGNPCIDDDPDGGPPGGGPRIAEEPDPNPDDPVGCSGHGTAVNGVLGAAWDNGIGGAGIAPNARLIAMRMCWDGDNCYDHIKPVAFDWAADREARVVTMSWLGGGDDLRDEIAGDTDTLFVAIAGGNGGPNPIEPNARPCVDPPANILCVSTSNANDELDCGPVSATHVDVAVPSRGMTTTINGGTFAPTGCATSYAGPIAGGVATILFGAFPEATPVQVKQAMISSARDVPAWAGNSVSGGVVNACAAVDALGQSLGLARPAGNCPTGGGGGGGTARCLGANATRVGSAGRDVINGTPRRDVIAGLGGNDLIRGLAGADLLCGGAGADVVNGGDNADRISGGAGNDRLLGGAGSDAMFGAGGRDALDGLAGRDTCNGGPARDTSRNCQILRAIP